MTSPFDFGALYGRADNSIWLHDAGRFSAVVETASFGRSRDGTKGQWTIKVRTTAGPRPGSALTGTITISPENEKALGMMFRDLGALGIPVPSPKNPNECINGPAPFWVMGWQPEQVAAAMVGKPVQVNVIHDEWEGTTRAKIRGFLAPLPGSPTTWPEPAPVQGAPQAAPAWGQPQQQPAPYGAPAGTFPGQVGGYEQQPQWGPPQPPQQPPPAGPPQPWQQAGQGMATAPPGTPQPWQGQPQYPGQAPAPGYDPAVPAWGQPGTPGQGGTAEFTQQGQSWQPGHMAPQPPQAPPTPWQGQPPQGQPQQVPPAAPQPPWQGQQAPPPQQPWNGQQAPQQAPQPPQGNPVQGPDAPPVPPWAQ